MCQEAWNEASRHCDDGWAVCFVCLSLPRVWDGRGRRVCRMESVEAGQREKRGSKLERKASKDVPEKDRRREERKKRREEKSRDEKRRRKKEK